MFRSVLDIALYFALSVFLNLLLGCSGGSSTDPDPTSNPNNGTPNQSDSVGVLDISFGSANGMEIFDGLQSEGYEIIFDQSGRILVAGRSLNEFNLNEFTIWRYLPDGSLDTSFAGTGYVTYKHKIGNTSSTWAWGIGVDSVGRIVATGEFSSIGDRELLLLRYNEDGSLDAGFGLNGVATYIGVNGRSLAINSDDSILITGWPYLLLKFTSDGVLDSTFGNNGIVKQGSSIGARVIKDNFGNILVSGYSVGVNGLIAVWRFLPNGEFDTTFGVNGRYSEVMGTYSALVGNVGNQLTIDSSNQIYIAGEVSNVNDTDRILIKIDEDGNMITEFGQNGSITYDSGRHDFGRHLVLVNDKIVITGSSVKRINYDTSDMQVFRYDANGTLDAGFGESGVITYDGYIIDRGIGITADASGKLLIVGSIVSEDQFGGLNINMAIWQYK